MSKYSCSGLMIKRNDGLSKYIILKIIEIIYVKTDLSQVRAFLVYIMLYIVHLTNFDK